MGVRLVSYTKLAALLVLVAGMVPSLAGRGAVASGTVHSLFGPSAESGAQLGRSVAAGDVNGDGYDDVVAAANYATVGDTAKAGTVHVFFGGPSFGDHADVSLLPSVPEGDASFGRFVAASDINGDGIADVIVPSYTADVDGKIDAGKIEIFLGGSTPDTTVDLILTEPAPEAGAHFGGEVDVSDVDADGRGDLIVGAHLADPGGVHDAGETFVFLGGPKLDTSADLVLTQPRPRTFPESGAEFGRDVAASDVNGDGVDDIFGGAAFDRVRKRYWAGRTHVFFGGSQLDGSADRALVEPRPAAKQMFGWSILGDVDLNADGVEDVVIGAPRVEQLEGDPYRSGSRRTEGRAHVFFGSPAFDKVADVSLTEPVPELGAHFGRDQMAGGDINHDSYDDIIIPAPFSDRGSFKYAGRVQVFFGGPSFDGRADLTLRSPVREDGFFGASTASGDIDGDGSDEIIVGASGASSPTVPASGAVYVFFRN